MPRRTIPILHFRRCPPPFRRRLPRPRATGPRRRRSYIRCPEFCPRNELVRRAATRPGCAEPARCVSSPRGLVRRRTAPGRSSVVAGSEEPNSRALRRWRRLRHLSTHDSDVSPWPWSSRTKSSSLALMHQVLGLGLGLECLV